MDIKQVILKLYPQIAVIRGELAYDNSGNEVLYDLSVINNYIELNKYKEQRASEYPTVGDQLDALWKGGEAAAAMLAQVQAVKAKYPKGTV